MKRMALIVLLGGSLAARGESPADPRRAMADGEKALAQSNLVEAAQHFARAAESAGTEKLDPAVPHYNRGIALLRGQQAAPAAEQFQLASRTTDLDLQQRALFNRGNALLKQAGELETAGQQKPALQTVEEALAMYEQAMMLRPRDPDPKVNFELASREKERLKELIQQQPPPTSQNQEQEKKDQQDQQQQPPPSSDSGQDQQQNEQGQQEPQQDSSPNQDEPKPDESPSSGAPQDMTREEATRLLDAMKEQEQANREQMARDRMRMNMGQLPPVEKDW